MELVGRITDSKKYVFGKEFLGVSLLNYWYVYQTHMIEGISILCDNQSLLLAH